MKVVKMRATVAYDGTDFHGFARQRGLRTVQGVLEEKLSGLTGSRIEVFGSGRTDAGVHAEGQVVHWEQSVGPPPERYPAIFQRILPRDLLVRDVTTVPDTFHARFSAVAKTYCYTIQTATEPDIFTRRYSWHLPVKVSLERMRQGAAYLVGEHDFTSFCAAATPVENKVRTVYRLSVEPRDSYLLITCTGSGFLQNMVRIITGTLVDVGLGKMDADRVPRILEARDRTTAGRTAPPEGLSLWKVYYDAEYHAHA